MNTSNDLKYKSRFLKSKIKSLKRKIEKDGRIILTPEMGYRIIWNPYYGRPLMIEDITKPKVKKNGPRTFIYNNHLSRSARKAPDELIKLAESQWRQAILVKEEDIHRGNDIEFAFDIYTIYEGESNPYACNCYIEEHRLEDVVNSSAAKRFKGLYDM